MCCAIHSFGRDSFSRIERRFNYALANGLEKLLRLPMTAVGRLQGCEKLPYSQNESRDYSLYVSWSLELLCSRFA